MSYPEYLPLELQEEFRREDEERLREARKERGFFRKLHAIALVSNDYAQEQLCKEIVQALDEEVRELERNTDKKSSRNIRFTDGASPGREGWTGDANQDVTNAERNYIRALPQKVIRYRWADEPRENNVGNADSNGFGEAGKEGVLPDL